MARGALIGGRRLLITDTSDGRHYVGTADGAESIHQRWNAYAANGHGGNVELRGLDPTGFRFSLLRVFDPALRLPAGDQRAQPRPGGRWWEYDEAVIRLEVL